MTLPIDNPQEILEWDMPKLWSAFLLTQLNDTGAESAELKKVKHGVNLNLPIHVFTNEWYTLYPESGNVVYRYKGTFRMDLGEFVQELEDRKTMLRAMLLDQVSSTGPRRPRVE